MPKKSKSYYFANGKKVALTPVEDLVAMADESLPSSVELVAKKDSSNAKATATQDSKTKKATQQKESFPVFSSGASEFVVALPEVRVQETSIKPSTKFSEWLTQNEDRVVVVDQKRGQTVLRPVSGKGEDALDIANEIYEAVKPSMSQPRFLRIVDRPDTTS